MPVTLEDLRYEYRHQTMGHKIVERIRRLVRQQLSHRDPQIYAGGARDNSDGVEDVLQDFTIDVLLGEGQLAYFFKEATSLDHFDALSNRQLNRYLARTRQRTIIDNLLERAVEALRVDDLVEVSGERESERFARIGTKDDAGPMDEQLFRLAVAVAANSVPKIYTNPDDRNPKIYSNKDLASLLRIFLAELGCAVTKNELQKLFEILLTPWIATLLGLDEAVSERPREIGPEDQVLVEATATRIAAKWSAEEVIVFRYKLSNISDTRLAERLGVSRPTAQKTKRRWQERMRADLEQLDAPLQSFVMTRLATLTDGVRL